MNAEKAVELLTQMRENCVPKENDVYDDPQRKAKYDALNYAIDVINNPSMAAMAMVDEEKFAVVENDCVEFYSKAAYDRERNRSNEKICKTTGKPCCECMPGGCP